ncbi:hypothetical protein TNCV_2804191 [Trichonephila clavipes]|nr:hypothetical protein TNCV_2804191 [Trichonephila clavipes]
MNAARQEVLKKELDSLLQQGIIVECESLYTSPVVLIPKPNGSMRLRIDYRKLNAQTVPDSYPLLRMDDLLNKVKPTPYMSTFDLRSGYNQVKVVAEDQDKTAFTCPFGIYKFTRMPFGLQNTPATFQRPTSEQEKADCDILAVFVDFPTRSRKEVCQEQLKDDELKKIIECFENNEKSVNFANWLERGYLMNQGILFHYSPTSESEEAQLVVPIHERQDILKIHHDAPNAGHYGADGTMQSNVSGLLRTPVYSQRFETISIDLFGRLPESPSGKKWIFIVEDCCTRWVELFVLPQATARECARTLMEEAILQYGLPRRLISDHGSQFVGAVMQQLCFILNIDQDIIPVYHPQANPVERKNRDLKPRIAIFVQNLHD